MQGFSVDDEGLLGEVAMPTQGSLRLAGPSYEAAKLVRKLLQVGANKSSSPRVTSLIMCLSALFR